MNNICFKINGMINQLHQLLEVICGYLANAIGLLVIARLSRPHSPHNSVQKQTQKCKMQKRLRLFQIATAKKSQRDLTYLIAHRA